VSSWNSFHFGARTLETSTTTQKVSPLQACVSKLRASKSNTRSSKLCSQSSSHSSSQHCDEQLHFNELNLSAEF